jgi:natural product precursor
MKKKAIKKLSLSHETLRGLQDPDLKIVIGGATATCNCGSCGNARSTCPV